MESLMEKVLYEGSVEFDSRTYGTDASLTEMLWTGPKKDFDPRVMEPPGMLDLGPGLDIGPGSMEPPGFEEKEKTYDEFVFTKKGAIIPYGGLVPEGDTHETFLADENGISGGHTSIYGRNKKIGSTRWDDDY